MRNLFMLIALLMTLSASSQGTITARQKERILQIFTASKIIDISKGISNEQKQDSIITARDYQIKEQLQKIATLEKEYKNLIKKVATRNNNILSAVRELKETKVLPRTRKFHLYGNARTNSLQLSGVTFSLKLSYEYSKVQLGVSGELTPNKINSAYSGYNTRLGANIRYTFF